MTSQFPFGNGEAFLGAEVRALAARVAAITVVAVRPQTQRPQVECGRGVHAFRWSTRAIVRDALRTLRGQPREVLGLVLAMFRAPYRLTAKLKNLAVFAKGLALAEYARREQITVIHAHWLTTPSTVALIAARLTRLPWSASAHRFDLFADNWIVEKVDCATAVRVISARGARDLRARLPPRMRDRVHVVHLGVEPPRHAASAKPNVGPLRIAAVGLLVAVKGHADLIDAVAQLRDDGIAVRCRIAGDGPLRERLQTQIDRLNLQAVVEIRGFVSHAAIMGEFGAGDIDVLAHPSIEAGRLHEGIPVAVMEAMAFGIPCVTTRTGSIPELVDDACGILVDGGDAGALARACKRLANDPALRMRLGTAARQRVLRDFNVHQTSAALLDLMQVTPPAVASTR